MGRQPTPHCPACAAPLPRFGDDGIVTCAFCGTDSNLQHALLPRRPLRSPPPSLEGRRSTGGGHTPYPHRRLPMEDLAGFCHAHLPNWDAGVCCGYLLTEPDAARRAVIAQTSGFPVWDKDALAWAPALAAEAIRAERAGEAYLALSVGLLLRDIAAGAGDKEAQELVRHIEAEDATDPDHSHTPPLIEHVYSTTGAIRHAENARATRAMLELSAMIEEECPESDVALIALAAAGPAAVQRLLDLAARARVEGDGEAAEERLECMRLLFAHLGETYQGRMDFERFSLQLDAAFHLMMTREGPEQAALVRAVADLADCHTNDPEQDRPLSWGGPRDVLGPILCFVDDMLHERPALARQLLDAIREQYRDTKGGWSHTDRWKEAIALVPSQEGRDACVRTYHEIAGPAGAKFTWEKVPDLAGSLPPLPAPPAPAGSTPLDLRHGIPLARAREGQAECPCCGRPLSLQERLLITTCDHCGRPARVSREVRMLLPGVREDDLGRWPPERLLETLRTSKDFDLRLAIAREIDTPLTDGAWFADSAGLLIEALKTDLPGDLGYAMDGAIKRLHRHRDEAFSAAMLDEFRARAFGPHQTERMLEAIAGVGQAAALVLIDYADANSKRAPKETAAVSTAMRLARGLLECAPDAAAPEQTRWILERMQDASDVVAANLADHLVHALLWEKPYNDSQPVLLGFIDNHLVPEAVEYSGYRARKNRSIKRPEMEVPRPPQPGSRARPETPEERRERHQTRDVANLINQMHLWRSDRHRAEDVLGRLRMLSSFRHDVTRLCVLNSIDHRPPDFGPAHLREARDLLRPMREMPDVAPSAAEALQVLSPPSLLSRIRAAFDAISRSRAVRRLAFWNRS